MISKILLLGDFSPVDLFYSPHSPDITFRSSISSIKSSLDISLYDLVLLNLETPVAFDSMKRKKNGPTITGNEKIISSFLKQNMVVNLANNHIMDCGIKGLENTINLCKLLNVGYCGAGANISSASAPIIREVNGIKIGILGCAEILYGVSTRNRPGFAPIIHGETERNIQKLSKEVDLCIVSVHGGQEMSPWPAPQWQEILRGFIDAGADIVHGHHSHIPQGYEKFKEGMIFYGLGNFMVDPILWAGHPNTGWSIAPELEISKTGIEKITINTLVMENEKRQTESNYILIHESKEQEKKIHKQFLEIANKPLGEIDFLAALWQELSMRLFFKAYSKRVSVTIPSDKLTHHTIKPFMIKAKLKTSKNFIKSIMRNDALGFYQLFACHNHREAIATALGIISGELDDLRTKETADLLDRMIPSTIIR